MVTTMTEPEIVSALRKRYAPQAGAFLEQVRSRTGYGGDVRTADALGMTLWPSRGLELHGMEIKVSRGDWKRERDDPAKAEEIAQYVDRWWLVVGDERIVEDGELPPAWGLLVPGKRGQLRVKQEAPKLEAKAPSRAFLAAVFRNLEQAKRGMVPREEFAQALAEARAEAAKELRESIAEGGELRTVTRELDTLRRCVDAFEKASGVSIQEWDAGEIGEAVRIVRALGVEGAIWGAENVLRMLTSNGERLAEQIKEARAAMDPASAPRRKRA